MTVPGGTRVRVRQRLLEPDERAPALPADTAALPYEAFIRGTLASPARVGGRATIRTATGRFVEGELDQVEPADTHSFGRPVPSLIATDAAISELVRDLGE